MFVSKKKYKAAVRLLDDCSEKNRYFQAEINNLRGTISTLRLDNNMYQFTLKDIEVGTEFVMIHRKKLHRRLLIHSNHGYAFMMYGDNGALDGPNNMSYVKTLKEVYDYAKKENYRLLSTDD